MTPEERTIVQVLIAVAWVDGGMDAPETGVIEGLLATFDTSPEEEAELLEFAKTRRTLHDADVSGLTAEGKDTLLRNAALLVCADGVEKESERRIVEQLAEILDVSKDDSRQIVLSVRRGLAGASRE